MVNTGAADELDEDDEKIGRLYSKIAYSRGVYGINGALLRDDETGQLYAIIGRSSTLFYFV